MIFRIKFIILILVISTNSFSQDLENKIDSIWSKKEFIDNNIKFTGPHIDGSIIFDSISKDSCLWAQTRHRVNDSVFIQEYECWSEKNPYRRYWYVDSSKVILCIEDGKFDSLEYRLDYYIENFKIIGISEDTILQEWIRKLKTNEIEQELNKKKNWLQ